MFHEFCFRVINPVVVSPTIAAVGLSFFSYGFPLVGTCLEIGAVQILVVIVFSLVSLFIWPISFLKYLFKMSCVHIVLLTVLKFVICYFMLCTVSS